MWSSVVHAKINNWKYTLYIHVCSHVGAPHTITPRDFQAVQTGRTLNKPGIPDFFMIRKMHLNKPGTP